MHGIMIADKLAYNENARTGRIPCYCKIKCKLSMGFTLIFIVLLSVIELARYCIFPAKIQVMLTQIPFTNNQKEIFRKVSHPQKKSLPYSSQRYHFYVQAVWKFKDELWTWQTLRKVQVHRQNSCITTHTPAEWKCNCKAMHAALKHYLEAPLRMAAFANHKPKQQQYTGTNTN